MSGRNLRRGCLIIISMAVLMMAAGCRIQPRVRTLPAEIQTVYVPMFINSSYEPGLEELATRATVEAFLADGRLNVVSKPDQADAIVQGIILSFGNRVSSVESDKFPLLSTMEVNFQMKLYSPKDRLNPLNEYEEVSASHSYVSDARHMTMTIPEDARQTLMEGLGRQAVLEVLTGKWQPGVVKK